MSRHLTFIKNTTPPLVINDIIFSSSSCIYWMHLALAFPYPCPSHTLVVAHKTLASSPPWTCHTPPTDPVIWMRNGVFHKTLPTQCHGWVPRLGPSRGGYYADKTHTASQADTMTTPGEPRVWPMITTNVSATAATIQIVNINLIYLGWGQTKFVWWCTKLKKTPCHPW